MSIGIKKKNQDKALEKEFHQKTKQNKLHNKKISPKNLTLKKY